MVAEVENMDMDCACLIRQEQQQQQCWTKKTLAIESIYAAGGIIVAEAHSQNGRRWTLLYEIWDNGRKYMFQSDKDTIDLGRVDKHEAIKQVQEMPYVKELKFSTLCENDFYALIVFDKTKNLSSAMKNIKKVDAFMKRMGFSFINNDYEYGEGGELIMSRTGWYYIRDGFCREINMINGIKYF